MKYSLNLTPKPGYTAVSGRDCELKFIAEFGVLRLDNGETHRISSGDNEVGILVLSGKCRLETGGQTYEVGNRRDVFSGLPQAAYIPPGYNCTVIGGPVEAALCQTKAERKDELRIIRETDVKVMQVGRDNWTREVRQMIPPKGFSQNLILGETLNPPGNWSGTPPHKHETENLPDESLHEELYYFRTDKPQGWGIQRTYSPERNANELIYLEDNVVTLMPWGYHQIVAGPGYNLYYLFCLAGKGNDLCGYEDPQHNWIK